MIECGADRLQVLVYEENLAVALARRVNCADTQNMLEGALRDSRPSALPVCESFPSLTRRSEMLVPRLGPIPGRRAFPTGLRVQVSKQAWPVAARGRPNHDSDVNM